VTPDEAALRRHLADPMYQAGERSGRYRLVHLNFPLAFFIVAAPLHADGPSGFLFRIDCTNYPIEAPSAQPWHGTAWRALSGSERPRSSQGGLLIAFSEWGPCLYHPMDRLGRPHWPDQHSDLVWKDSLEITDFLEMIHGLLHDPKYAGAAVSAEALVLLPPVVEAPVQ